MWRVHKEAVGLSNLSIRRGEWTFDAIMAHAEKIQAEIESGKDRLRLVPDRDRIDELIAEVMNEAGVM